MANDTPLTTSSLSRAKWVIGTPYFVQGTSNLTEIPILYFIKFGLGMGDAGGQLFNSLRNAGWFVKPVWGYLSDRVPLLGYHRKSWYVLMALLAVVFWAVNAALIAIGVRSSTLFLLTFNLAFATYAFVDVVCDALMVTWGRQLKRIGSLVNFQWTVLAVANAGAVFLGGWFQEQVQAGQVPLALIFLATGIPPLLTAIVGLRNIEEERVLPGPGTRRTPQSELLSVLHCSGASFLRRLRDIPARLTANRTVALLALFIFFWKFSPSIGYIERSYLIDVRQFDPTSFGIILSAGSLTFLASILAYRWMVQRFRCIAWHHYLYAVVAIGVLSFPLSFFLYLDPGHPWWDAILWFIPDGLDLIEGWNRYEWFRLVTQVVLGFAMIPALLIPLTIAGETVKVESAGVSYAFLMALSNVMDLFEGAVGAGLYTLFSLPALGGVLRAFQGSIFEVAGTSDVRTLILEIFVYISLTFTLLTLPFIELLRRELARRGIAVDLVGSGE
jgi:hypothetical protein